MHLPLLPALRRCFAAHFLLVLVGGAACIHDYELTEGGDGAGGAGGAPNDECLTAAESEPGSVDWLYAAGDADLQAIRDLVVDAEGNVVVVGYFRGSLDFGLGELTSSGDFDQFLAKLDCAGNPLFALRFSGNVGEQPFTRLAVDVDGDIIVAGELAGTFDFGAGSLSSADGDVFVAKLSPTGETRWQRSFGGPGRQLARAVGVDPAGRVIVGGYFQGTMTVGEDELTSVSDAYDSFLLRLTEDGEPIDYRVFGSPSEEFVEALAVSEAGRVALTGVIEDPDVGVSFGDVPLVSSGGDDAFVAVFDDQLEPVWSAGFGSADPDIGHYQQGKRIVFQGEEIVVMARVSGAIDFGGGLLEPPTLGIALARFSADGQHLSSKAFEHVAFAHGLVALDGGDVGIGGESFAALDLGGPLLPNFGQQDLFFARLGAEFEHRWSRAYGGSLDDQVFAMGADGQGALLLGGNFRQALDFDKRPLESAGDADLWIARVAR